MMPALLFVAMLTGAVSFGMAIALSAPIWLAVLAYSVVGTVVILGVVALRITQLRSSTGERTLAAVPNRAGSA